MHSRQDVRRVGVFTKTIQTQAVSNAILLLGWYEGRASPPRTWKLTEIGGDNYSMFSSHVEWSN